MSMKICTECGTEISNSAKVCPKCGKNQKNFFQKHIILTSLIIFASIGIIVSNGETAQNNTETSSITNIQKQEKVTLEKFNQIQTGMTYQQVVDIIGEEGTLSTESSFGNQTMQIYYWYASNGISNTTISFSNGKVSAKSQIGL